MDETNATPESGGASTLERIERFLSPEAAPKPEPKAQAEVASAAPVEVEPHDDGAEQAPESQLSTSDLAKYLGVDETALDLDEDGTVKLRTKIDGVEGAAKLTDLLKSYQLEGHVNRRSMELAEREKAQQAREQQVQQQHAQELANAKHLSQFAMAELTKEWQSIDWQTLDQQDPGQAARLWQKYQSRVQQIQQGLQGIDYREQQMAAQREQQLSQSLEQEAQRIPTLIPEWKDQAVRQKEAKELIDWGLKSGYPIETLRRLDQSSALDVATFRKAMLYDRQQQAKPGIENRIRAAPKLVKPGQAQPATEAQKLQNLKLAVKKSSGNNRSIEDYLVATGRV